MLNVDVTLSFTRTEETRSLEMLVAGHVLVRILITSLWFILLLFGTVAITSKDTVFEFGSSSMTIKGSVQLEFFSFFLRESYSAVGSVRIQFHSHLYLLWPL